MERGGVGGRVISVVLLKHPPDPERMGTDHPRVAEVKELAVTGEQRLGQDVARPGVIFAGRGGIQYR